MCLIFNLEIRKNWILGKKSLPTLPEVKWLATVVLIFDNKLWTTKPVDLALSLCHTNCGLLFLNIGERCSRSASVQWNWPNWCNSHFTCLLNRKFPINYFTMNCGKEGRTSWAPSPTGIAHWLWHHEQVPWPPRVPFPLSVKVRWHICW